MFAIYKRELKSYFSSAIGYAVLTTFLFFASLFFVMNNLLGDTSNMMGVFSSLILIYVFIIPILTMRTFSEEKRNKTDQALLTAPVSLLGIVMGKFLAALTVYAIGLSVTVIFSIIIGTAASVETFVIIGNIVGMLLVGSALIAIGIFISNLTESQIVAAVLGIFALLFLYLIENLAYIVPVAFLQTAIKAISIGARYNNFSMGIFDISDAVFYLSIAGLFLFFTTRMLEKRRWS